MLTWDTIRWLNVLMSSGVVALLLAGSIARWDIMPLRIRRVIPWIIFTYVIIAYGSAEIAWQTGDASPGLRVVLLLLNLIGLIVALVYNFADDDYAPPLDGPTQFLE